MQASRINTLGTIYMEDKVISKIVAEAVKTCYGIVGLAGTNTLTGLIQLLTQDPTAGVLVDVDGNELVLTLSRSFRSTQPSLLPHYSTRIPRT